MLDLDVTARLLWFVLFFSVFITLGVALLNEWRRTGRFAIRLPRPLAYVLFAIGCLLIGFAFRMAV